MAATSTARHRQLQWRCRRGMRELDMVLQRYLNERYASATRSEQAAFAKLLEYPDAELLALLLGQQVTEDDRIAGLITTIRDAAQF